MYFLLARLQIFTFYIKYIIFRKNKKLKLLQYSNYIQLFICAVYYEMKVIQNIHDIL